MSYVIAIQNPTDHGQCPLEVPGSGWFGDEEGDVQFCSPYGRPGDQLWIREAWSHAEFTGMRSEIAVAEERLQQPNFCHYYSAEWLHSQIRWTPRIHMPRRASRILLEVTDMRVERMQDIGVQDCFAEGIDLRVETPAKTQYARLWDEINGDGPWAANPWDSAVSFRDPPPTGGKSPSLLQDSTVLHGRENA